MLPTLNMLTQSPRFVGETFEAIHNCMLLSGMRTQIQCTYRYVAVKMGDQQKEIPLINKWKKLRTDRLGPKVLCILPSKVMILPCLCITVSIIGLV